HPKPSRRPSPAQDPYLSVLPPPLQQSCPADWERLPAPHPQSASGLLRSAPAPPPAAFRPGWIRSGKRRRQDRKSTRLNSSHVSISYAVFCLKKKIIYISTLRRIKHEV